MGDSRVVNLYLKDGDKIEKKTLQGKIDAQSAANAVWIDILEPAGVSVMAMDELIRNGILTADQVKSMEGASEFSEGEGTVVANPNFFVLKDHSLQVEPVAFVVTQSGKLVSLRHSELEAFNEIDNNLCCNSGGVPDGFELFVEILRTRITRDVSIVEHLSHEITQLSNEISTSDKIDKSLLYRIIALQEQTMILRENTFDLQKVLNGILRSKNFTKDQHAEARLMVEDVDSLISHAEFGFQRLDYFQDTALGLINIEQNEITKIFSVAAVIFMPPTLVASVYGMNFKYMPELNWGWTMSNGWVIPMGYLFALFLMVLFTLLTVWFFKYKKWL